jgi:hypothetical protein
MGVAGYTKRPLELLHPVEALVIIHFAGAVHADGGQVLVSEEIALARRLRSCLHTQADIPNGDGHQQQGCEVRLCVGHFSHIRKTQQEQL